MGRYFNIRVYLIGLKQLRKSGLIFIAVTIFFTMLPVFFGYTGFYLNLSTSAFEPNTVPINHATQVPDIQYIASFLIILMTYGALVYVFRVFSFLNKRNACDLYHSLPQTRACTYVSLTASVLTWLYATIAGTLALVFIGYAMKGTPLPAAYFSSLLFTYLSGATLTTGAALIAISITGTRFSNIAVAAVILLLPRFLLSVFAMTVNQTTPVIWSNELGFLLDPSANIPAAFFLSGNLAQLGIADQRLFQNTSAIVYSAVLGFGYIALGGVLYNKRKSEVAGKGAPDKKLQHLFRALATLPFLLTIPYMFFISRDAENGDTAIFTSFITALVFSLAVYFLYELITTKTTKNLVRIMPYYLVVVAAAGVLTLGAIGLYRAMIGNTPEAQNIAFVSIDIPETRYQDATYLKLHTQAIRFSDPKIAGIVSKGLKSLAEKPIVNSEQNNIVTADQDDSTQELMIGVVLKDGTVLKRRMILSQADYDEVQYLRYHNREFSASFRDLPKPEEISDLSIDGLDTPDCDAIWKSFKAEAPLLSDSQFRAVSSETLSNDSDEAPGTLSEISIKGQVSGTDYSVKYKITGLTPKTAALYINSAFTKLASYYKQQFDSLSRVVPAAGLYYDYSITLENAGIPLPDNTINGGYSSVEEPDESSIRQDRELFTLLKGFDLKPADVTKAYACIHIYRSEWRGEDDSVSTIAIALTESQLKALSQYFNTAE